MTSHASSLSQPVLLGVITSPHGIKGELHIHTYTETPDNIVAYGPLMDSKGIVYHLRLVRVKTPQTVVVRLDGVHTRDQAEHLRGTQLFVESSLLPSLEEDVFYHKDLIGLFVIDEEGVALGVVSAIENFGAGDILEIDCADHTYASISFTREAVPEISIAERYVKIQSAYLINAIEAEAQEESTPASDKEA